MSSSCEKWVARRCNYRLANQWPHSKRCDKHRGWFLATRLVAGRVENGGSEGVAPNYQTEKGHHFLV